MAFRLILLPAAPSLSDDIWRYIWEGGVQLSGINPYRYVPSAPELVPLRQTLDAVYQGVNYKDLPAIYPPLMQWVFALGAAMGRSATAMKLVFVAADLGLLMALARLLTSAGHPAARILVYAWNPLVVLEVAGSGHNDSLALCFLVGSTAGIIGHRKVLSIAALGLAALSKLFPIAMLPLYAKKVKPWQLAIAPAVMLAGYLPYLSAGPMLFHSLRQYAERWRYNESIFSFLEAAVEASGISPVAKAWVDARGLPSLYTQPHMIARLLAAGVALGVLAALAWRLDRADPVALPRAIFIFTGTVLLLQPVMHPWYLIWIAPWLVLFPSPAWLLLTGLAPLSYAGVSWARWVEYLPFFALLLMPAAVAGRRRLWRRARPLW